MSDSLASLQRKISSAQDLQSVVRTMKAMAAASIGQFETAVLALDDYYHTLELGLRVCLKQQNSTNTAMSAGAIQRYQPSSAKGNGNVTAVVLGSDQGLVGQFNETMAGFVIEKLEMLQGEKHIWTIGERIQARLSDSPLNVVQHFSLPGSLEAITPLVADLLLALETGYEQGEIGQVYLFHHKPQSREHYSPCQQRLLPLDHGWYRNIVDIKWPGSNLPQVIGNTEHTLLALVHEYLFVSLFRSCAESLASENASRLLAMQRAEKNITELQDDMQRHFHRLRQSGIDEELFDLVASYDVLKKA